MYDRHHQIARRKKTVNQVVSNSVALVLNVMMCPVLTRVPGRRFIPGAEAFLSARFHFCARKNDIK